MENEWDCARCGDDRPQKAFVTEKGFRTNLCKVCFAEEGIEI